MKMIPAIILALLAGCAAQQRAETARRAQVQMVGMQKRDLYACAGLPVRSQTVDGFEYLVYEGGGDTVTAGVASGRATAYGNTAYGSSVGVSKSARRYCQATFVLKDNVVQGVSYQGRTGGLLTRGEQCAFIVENCVR